MKRRCFFLLSFSFLLVPFIFGQKVQNPKFDARLHKLLDFSVPVINVDEAFLHREKYLFVDAREKEEYDTSHIKGSVYIGYNDFDPSSILKLDKKIPIIIYCSVGYRSEKIAEKLQKQGFDHVFNLYGSIFEWVNQGYPIYHGVDTQTNILHTYNKKWSQWVDNPRIKKIW